MSDLSQLLDDLYALPGADTDADADEAPAATRAPEWSSEEALDEVFASWVPGPGDDASSAERSIVSEVHDAPVAEVPPMDTWLSDTEPTTAASFEELAPVVTLTPMTLRWSPSDDDILPRKRGPRRSLRRR
jgi:hypothetical protein